MEFRGWRRYSLRLEDGRLALCGVRQEWKSPVFTAQCFAGPIAECPMETAEEARERSKSDEYRGWHGCGIHSFKTLGSLMWEYGRYAREVIAEVVNYGRVDEYEHGYRAEHTRILKMYLIAEKDSQADYLEALRRVLETRFGVPVVVTSLDDLIAEHAPDYRERSVYEGTMTHAFITHAATALQRMSLNQNQSVFYVQAPWYWNGAKSQWQTLANASSDTTTSPNRSQRRSGNPSPSKNPSPSTDSDIILDGKGYTLAGATKPTKKKPVEANLPANNKKWWLKR